MNCRKCCLPLKIEDITRAGNYSDIQYVCTYCGTSCSVHIKRRKRTEHWFICTDKGMEYIRVETNKKEQK